MKKIIGHYRKCDFLTLFGTLSSFIGIILTINNYFTTSILCMIISGLCDAFDGTLARKYKYSKEQNLYGIQLDSLSDIICFGLFPAALTCSLSNNWYSYLISGFYLICGVIRLAYFNTISIDGKNKKNIYIGLPITTCSILYPIIFLIFRFINFSLIKYVMPILLLVLAILFIIRIEIPKPNISLIIKKIFNKYVFNFFAFPLFLLIGSDFIYKLNMYNLKDTIKLEINTICEHFLPFILVYIFIVVLFLLLNSLFKKSKISKVILLTLFSIILIVNEIKFNIMGIPLEISDINYLSSDGLAMMGNSISSIGIWIFISILKIFIFALCGIIFIMLDKKLCVAFNNKLKRFIVLILSILMFIFLCLMLNYKNTIVLEKIYNTSNNSMLEINSAADMYNDYGFFQGVILNFVSKNINNIDGYVAQNVNSILEKYNDIENDSSWGKANVVFILSEAFSDINNIDGIRFDKDVMSNINSYANDKDKMVFDLVVPSYGGASANTEFEVLTGASLNFFKAGFIPYTDYYNNVNGKIAPNIIREFNNNNYETVYLTPWDDDLYKSKYVLSMFGTSKLIYGNNLSGDTKGEFYSDKSLMNDIFNELKDTSVGNYKFIMSATAQNHYPFNENKYKEYDINVEMTKYNDEDSNILRSYAQWIYDADKELNNLYEMIQTLDVPTIVVFFGDHLPYTINSKGDDPYTSGVYFNTDDNMLNIIRKYTTKAVVFSNYDINVDNIEYMNSSYLGAYVLNKMDLDISDYFKFVDDMRKNIPGFNRRSIYVDSNVISIDKLDTEYYHNIQNYKFVQYNKFFDYNNDL